jgi:hypothetical protein
MDYWEVVENVEGGERWEEIYPWDHGFDKDLLFPVPSSAGLSASPGCHEAAFILYVLPP